MGTGSKEWGVRGDMGKLGTMHMYPLAPSSSQGSFSGWAVILSKPCWISHTHYTAWACTPELLQWRQLQFTLRAESTLPLLWDLSRGSDTGTDPFCTILLGHSEAMKPAQCPVSTWALHVVSSPLSLPTSLVHTQGAGLVQGLWPHSTQSSNYNKSSNVDLSVLHYTDQKLWFLRRKQVFWNMIYFSRRLR